jgi:hypothetical protein
LDASRERRLNLYEVLQVSTSASPEVVQAAYRALARSYHPDVNPSSDAARRMRQLNAAYSVLSDPVRRARYDTVRTRPMRARHEPVSTTPATRVAPRAPANITVLRGGAAAGSMSPLPRHGSPRLGRLLVALAVVLLFIGALTYGVWLAAGALEDEPTRAMVPNTVQASQSVPINGR